jgi:Flp pilus assembly protein TadD
MRRRAVGSIRYGLFAMALAVVPLSGCNTMDFAAASNFGPAQPQVASLPDIGSYTADRALAEARGHFRNNDFGDAAALYQKVVELSPKDPEGYIGLGASYDHLGRFDLADRVYGSLYALTGGTAQYYNNVGYSNMLRGNLTAAMTNFRNAKRLDPENVVIADNLQILANATAGSRA